MKRIVMVATAAALLMALSACGDDELVSSAPKTRPTETSETLAVLTDPPSETTSRERRVPEQHVEAVTADVIESASMTCASTATTTTKASTLASTTTTTTTVAATEPFTLSDIEVADKMHAYFSEKGYTDAQIAGIVGNAEVESGLEPSRGVPGGGFGLFQLMDCPQRREMLAEFDAEGVGKYATSQYWDRDASDFDTAEDFDTFMTVMLDYTMNEDDPTWMSELQTVDSPEAAAEVFLVHYERAVNGGSPIEYYAPYSGRYYQATSSRREAARRWYEYFTA